jgi:hypothetical protein
MATKQKGNKLTERTAREINRLLRKAVIVLLTASALILAAPIAAGIELLVKG